MRPERFHESLGMAEQQTFLLPFAVRQGTKPVRSFISLSAFGPGMSAIVPSPSAMVNNDAVWRDETFASLLCGKCDLQTSCTTIRVVGILKSVQGARDSCLALARGVIHFGPSKLDLGRQKRTPEMEGGGGSQLESWHKCSATREHACQGSFSRIHISHPVDELHFAHIPQMHSEGEPEGTATVSSLGKPSLERLPTGPADFARLKPRLAKLQPSYNPGRRT